MSKISDIVLPNPGSTSTYNVITSGSAVETTNPAANNLQNSKAKIDLLPCRACKRKYIPEEYRIPPGAPTAGRRDYPANYVGSEALRPRYYAQCKICRDLNNARMRKVREARRGGTGSVSCGTRFADGIPNDVVPAGTPTEVTASPTDQAITPTVAGDGDYGSSDSLNQPERPRHVIPESFLSRIASHPSNLADNEPDASTTSPAARRKTDFEPQAVHQGQANPSQVPDHTALTPKIVNNIYTGNVKTSSTFNRTAHFVLGGTENNPPARHAKVEINTAETEVVSRESQQCEKGKKRAHSTRKRVLPDNQTEGVAISVKYKKGSDGKKVQSKNRKALQIEQYVAPDFLTNEGNAGLQQQKDLQPTPSHAFTNGVTYNATSTYYAPQRPAIEEMQEVIKNGRAALDMYQKLAVQLGGKILLVKDLDIDNTTLSQFLATGFTPVGDTNQYQNYKSGMNSSSSYGPAFEITSYSSDASENWPFGHNNQHDGYKSRMNSGNIYGPAFGEASHSLDASKQLPVGHNNQHEGHKSGMESGNSYGPAFEGAYSFDASENWPVGHEPVGHNNQLEGYVDRTYACQTINPPIEKGGSVPEAPGCPANGQFDSDWLTSMEFEWPLPSKAPDHIPIDPALLDVDSRYSEIPELISRT